MNRGVLNCIGFSSIIYISLFYCDFILIYYEFAPKLKVNWPVGFSLCLLYHVILFLLIICHIRILFSNPGKVTTDLRLSFESVNNCSMATNSHSSLPMLNGSRMGGRVFQWTYCHDCEMMRPPRSFHCQSCKCCVERMDHHCDWINNCVGASNQKYFIQAVFYGFMFSLLTIIFTIYALFAPASASRLRYMHYSYVSLISMNFGISSFIVLYTQIRSILKDQTGMEAVNLRFHFRDDTKKAWDLLREVFGPSHLLCWILPCSKPMQVAKREPQISEVLETTV